VASNRVHDRVVDLLLNLENHEAVTARGPCAGASGTTVSS
jgi:hypothetical protein